MGHLTAFAEGVPLHAPSVVLGLKSSRTITEQIALPPLSESEAVNALIHIGRPAIGGLTECMTTSQDVSR